MKCRFNLRIPYTDLYPEMYAEAQDDDTFRVAVIDVLCLAAILVIDRADGKATHSRPPCATSVRLA